LPLWRVTVFVRTLHPETLRFNTPKLFRDFPLWMTPIRQNSITLKIE